MILRLPRFDSHLHQALCEGLVIGIEGNPKISGLISNNDAFEIRKNNTFVAWYVRKEQIQEIIAKNEILKFHPRREKYTPEEVVVCIEINQPRLVIFDTLNYPYWEPSDYFEIVRKFPKTIFLLAHAGGIQMNSFVPEIILSNVYFDFSATMVIFEVFKNKKRREGNFLTSAIRILVSNPNSRKRLLFGSDAPMYSRENTFRAYKKFGMGRQELDANFLGFIDEIGL